jgi:hypothetical protein
MTREARGNLPALLSTFIGREQALLDLHELIGTARLVTLTGAGGVGKTRLALEFAAAVAERFHDGAWWCSTIASTSSEFARFSATGWIGILAPVPGLAPAAAHG